MVRPMAGALDVHEPRILEVLYAPVHDWIGSPAFSAADEQDRAGDLAPQFVLRPI